MSRALSSVQNKRAGPSQQPQFNPRIVPPQPSIKSAQLFSQQGQNTQRQNIQRPNTQGQNTQGQNIQGQNIQRQNIQRQNIQEQDKKQMTIKHAITLITLRLGVLETTMMNMEQDKMLNQYTTNEAGEELVMIDKSVLNTLTSRLEAIEKRPSNGMSSDKDVILLKSQMEQFKPSIVQTKQATINVVKENKMLKERMEEMMVEMSELKRVVEELRENVTLNNNEVNGEEFAENEAEEETEETEETEEAEEIFKRELNEFRNEQKIENDLQVDEFSAADLSNLNLDFSNIELTLTR